MQANKTSRDRILAALRAGATPGTDAAQARLLEFDDRSLYADYPSHAAELLTAFATEFRSLHGELLIAADPTSAALELLNVIKGLGVARIASQPSALLSTLRAASPELARRLEGSADLPTDPRALASYKLGITICDHLVARTGSVVLTSGSAGGRVLSVLPEVHVVLATEDQLVFSLEDWLAKLAHDDIFRMAALISGPSRTADIEKILVLGAHGPKRLVVVLLREARRSSRPPPRPR